MTTNWSCPAHKCRIMELLPFFMDTIENEEDMSVSPSRLLYEMQLSTEERLEQLSKPTRRRRTTTIRNAFSRTPDIVVFQNFETDKVYKTTITLQNTKQVSRHLTIEKNTSPFFEVVYVPECSPIKVAPGMTYTVQIVFKPDVLQDYVYDVRFLTDEETFSVPVYAIGSRALLNIPDCLVLNSTAIRVPTEKNVVLYNFGKVQANYSVTYEEPLKVLPPKGVLMPNQAGEMQVICTPPNSTTNIESVIFFVYDDVKLKISVKCDVVSANIQLDSSAVFFGEIYMGLETYKTVTLYNKSNFILDFRWKAYKSEAVDLLERSKLLQAMKDMTEMEKKKYVKLEYMNIIDGEGHSRILDKNLEDESEMMEEEFLYKSRIFSILPMEGRIVPNQSIEFTFIFRPRKNDYYTSMAYLDITGNEDRLPVSLAGGGKGPDVVFNVTVLDIEDVFLNATHEYQLVVKNNGHIPATVTFKDKETDFGGIVKCLPKTHHLKKFEYCKSFVISFTSSVQGKFVEKIQFVIQQSKEIVGILLVGNVVCPLLKPTMDNIDFGKVSYGFKPVKEFNLVNESQVPVDFKLMVAGKSGESTEFDFEPNEGVVGPFSRAEIKVTLNTTAIQTIEEDLIVIMWGARQHSTIIPLTYDCVCPDIVCTPSEIAINFCFLNYEYKRNIIIKNTSSTYGYLTYTPEEEPKDMTCDLNKKEVMIFPEEEIDIELTIKTDVLGIHEYSLIFTMSGSKPQSLCKIRCNGQGPVLTYDPEEVHFGKVTLLNEMSTTLSLINDSPIWAEMKISTKENSPFVPSVNELRIGPEDKTDITVTCYLKNTGKIKDYVNVDILGGESISIAVFAEGIGYSILCEPSLVPEYDAGTLLTYQFFSLPVLFTNLGRKSYKILWTRKQAVKSFKAAMEDEIPSVFRLEPNYFELVSNQTQSVALIGQSKRPTVIQEDFYCYATIDKSTKVESIMSCIIKAEFVDPSMEFSKYCLNFVSVNEGVLMTSAPKRSSAVSMIPLMDYDEAIYMSTTTERIMITNETPTPISLALKTTSDFYIMQENNPTNSLHHKLSANDVYQAVIEFRPQLLEKRYNMKKGRLMVDVHDHPKTNTIDLTGEVCFPTVKLHPDHFDFKCIPTNSYSVTNIILQNVTFLPVVFTWELFEDLLEIEQLPEMKLQIASQHEDLVAASSTSSSGIDAICSSADQKSIKSKSILSSGIMEKKSDTSRSPEITPISPRRPTKLDKKPFNIGIERVHDTQSVSHAGDKPVELTVEWDAERYESESRKVLRNIVADFLSPEESEDALIFDDLKPKKASFFNNLITIEPSHGFLEPYEYILVSVGFFPPPNVKVTCTAVCAVEGGEFESLVITGMSSCISYKLSTAVIEYGRQLFCEICEKSLTLKNDGFADFHFEIVEDEVADGSNLKTGWSSVTPAKGFLRSGESVKLAVKYFPGVTGEFNKDITFEIGYLEPITVHLHGYAIFSQLVLSLPRPSIQEISPVLMYKAIASITKPYLLNLNDIVSQNVEKYVVNHSRPEDINEFLYDQLIEDDWVVVSDNYLYPSAMEIDLSIERTLLNEYLQEKADVLEAHASARRTDLIPGFAVPPYYLDFGYVAVDKPVCYTVLIVSRCPTVVPVKLVESKSSTLEQNGFKIEYQNKKMAVGAMTELFLILNPTQAKFGSEDKSVEERFLLRLSHGGIVPVEVRAVVTRPKVKTRYACVDFGAVKTGTVLRRAIIIENDGHLPSAWTADVQTLSKRTKNAYWMLPKKGELEPGKKDLLNVYFAPVKKGFYNSKITISVEGNCIPIEMQLCGHGAEPSLIFSEKELRFKNSLPYSKEELSFLVQNVSTFPIEFCFQDLDRDFYDEMNCVELYLDTHNLDSVLLPERHLGSRLPELFQSNYISLLNRLRQEKSVRDDDQETEEESSSDPLEHYSKDEVLVQMKDLLKTMNFEDDDTKTDVCIVEDDLNARVTIIEPEKPTIDQPQTRNGVFLIFHGAPLTGYYKAANRAGRALSLKVCSIDSLIYEELLMNESQPAMEINELIENTLKTNKVDVVAHPGDDAYDLLVRKIKSMSAGHSKKSKKSKGSADKSQKSDKSSDKKKSGSKSGGRDAASISIDSIWALLKKRFESAEEGLIIESLHSAFLTTTDVALDCLLRAIGCAKYVQVVILSYTLDNYVKNEERKLVGNESEKNVDSDKSPKRSPKGSKKGSEKGSVKSRGKTDKSKQILKAMPKELKGRFEQFRQFLDDLIFKCQFWEKRPQSPMRPPSSRQNTMLKGDAKSSTKDSGKDSKTSAKNKGKAAASSYNLKTLVSDALGIPLWIFNNCWDDRYIDEGMLSAMLKNNRELADAIRDLSRKNETEVLESSTTFSVFKKIKRRRNVQLDEFKICHGVMEIVKSDCQVSITTVSKKKGTKRRLSADKKSDRSSLTSSAKEAVSTPFLARKVLQPGDILKYQVSFSPVSCGKYTNTYALSILGTDSTQSVKCSAVCELPTINSTPEAMFPNCRESYDEKILGDRFTYFKEENVFDFGSIIVGTSKSHPYKTNLTLQNASDLQCITNIELNENSLFLLEPTELVVEPNESLVVTLSLKAPKKGNVTGEMFISVKNNPEIGQIKLMAHSCPLEIHVSPKLITFEKVPTGYCMKKTITLKNSSPVDFFWKLAKADWIRDIYKLSETSGEIKLYSVKEITVEYSPTEEETNTKKNIEIQIFDLHQSEVTPLQTDSIALQSDALDYIVEHQDHIDLGERKGKILYKIPFQLLNKGKCNINIVFSMLDNILPKDKHLVRRFFKLNSENETLQPQKTTTVVFHFHPTEEVTFDNVPVFNCSLVELDRPENVIRSFIITFSGTVHLSRFTLCPNSNMYFGYQQVFSSKSQKLELTNTGKCAFEYKILQLSNVLGQKTKEKPPKKKKSGSDSSKKTGSKKSDAGSGKSKKSKDKKKEKKVVHIAKLEVPGFSLVSSIGVVEPKETVQINVECNPQKPKQYKEVVVVFVSEPQEADVNGRKITLHAEGCEPSLNFADVQKMFREHFIVEEMEQFICPENIGAHCIFVKSDTSLHLRNVCVSETYKTKIHIQNFGQVIANVSAKMTDTKSCFSVSPNTLSIEPYSSEYVTINFKPDSINTFESKLEISYNASTDNVFTLSLIGESCVPQIRLLKPKVDESNRVTMNFDPTYVDLTTSQEVEIQNVGHIPCKVIMDLCENRMNMFSLKPCGNTVDLLNLHGHKDFEVTVSSTMVNLLPFQKAKFSLTFCPKTEKLASTQLKIHTVNNPFEVINETTTFLTNSMKGVELYPASALECSSQEKFLDMLFGDTKELFSVIGTGTLANRFRNSLPLIDVNGEGFYNDIYLSGLPTAMYQSTITYMLDFGYTSLNRLEKKCFTIRNNSTKNAYKFEFTNVDKLMLIPRVGHLKPSTGKEIIATVSTRKPMCTDKIKMECKFIHIEFVDSEEEGISWDDRQQSVISNGYSSEDNVKIKFFQEALTIAKRELLRSSSPDVGRRGKQCILERTEPEINLVANAWETIPIFFSITADYANFECRVKELIFPDTYVNQKSEVSFVVVNVGMVPLHIEWVLNCDEILLPKRVSSANFNETKETLLAPAPSLETSMSSTTLFSSESFMGDDPLPFEIFPKQTVIQTTRSETFRLVFTPLVASQYYLRLISNIPSLEQGVRNMDISVTAESLVPDCYFELDEPDYVGKRDGNRGSLEEKTVRVVEMISVGIGETSVKTFYVVNTSTGPLPFKIEPMEADNRFTYVHCKTPAGFIQPGKKFELVFSFTPQELGKIEERYLFTVEINNFSMQLLVVGMCREPKVYFTKAHVDISATLWKSRSEETIPLKNEEESELSFKFLKSSFYSDDHEQQLTVVPLSGLIPAKGEYEIRLIYNADKIGESNFHLKCAIQKLKYPLNLSVTAKCLEVITSISYIGRDGSKIMLDPKIENRIDLGNIGIKLKRELKFQISNAGQTGFFYTWLFNKSPVEYSMDISSGKMKDFVPTGSCSKSVLIIEALRKYHMKDFKLKLEISYGPTYVMKLNAFGAETMCKFSFTNYNFGNCLVQKDCSKYYKTILEVKNCENRPVILENFFENSDDLTVDFKSGKLMPNCHQNLPIYFHPRKVGKFDFSLPILVDSSKRTVKITGEGVKLNVQLVNLGDKFITFDGVRVGGAKKHRLQIVNKTQTQVDINLVLLEDQVVRTQDEKIEAEIVVPELPPISKETTIKSKKGPSSVTVSDKASRTQTIKTEGSVKKEEKKKSKENLIVKEDIAVDKIIVKKPKKYLTIHPKNYVPVEACKKCEFIVEFKPNERIENFAEKIYYRVQDYLEPLCVVKGSCISPEFSLDKRLLTFSNVVIGCKHILNVLLRNTGDTKGRFKWSFEKSAGDFKIYPTEGFINSKSDMKIWISFEPTAVYCQIFKNVLCTIDEFICLHLQLIANSSDLPKPLGTVNFSCPVRTSTTGQITLTNNTKTMWCLNPVLKHKYFSVPTEIIVPAESFSNVEIEYKPKKMFGTQPHKASLFLPLPDGQAIIYDLVGNALPPLAITRLEIEVKCKQNHTETLSIENWLEMKQCFEVKTELLSTPTAKTLYKAFGHNLIEVPPNAAKNYKWNIYVINEEQLEFKVVFTNIDTQEYIFYEIFVKVLPSGPLETINLNGRVRERTKTTIKLKNPINIPVVYNINAGVSDLVYERIVRVEPYTSHDLVVTYCPLTAGKVSTTLEARCDELGSFTYTLNLSCSPPPLEKVLRFKAELGDRGYNWVFLKNTFASPVELSSTFDHAVFSAEKAAPLLPGESEKLTIKFEPSDLGVVESRAVFSYSTTGEYIYLLIGECVLPTPKGPYSVKSGGTAQIPFFNPFLDQKTFNFSIDSDLFMLKSNSDVFKGRKSSKIFVSLPSTIKNLDTNLKCPITARLIVTCDDEELNFIKWVFYIQSDR